MMLFCPSIIKSDINRCKNNGEYNTYLFSQKIIYSEIKPNKNTWQTMHNNIINPIPNSKIFIVKPNKHCPKN